MPILIGRGLGSLPLLLCSICVMTGVRSEKTSLVSNFFKTRRQQQQLGHMGKTDEGMQQESVFSGKTHVVLLGSCIYQGVSLGVLASDSSVCFLNI